MDKDKKGRFVKGHKSFLTEQSKIKIGNKLRGKKKPPFSILHRKHLSEATKLRYAEGKGNGFQKGHKINVGKIRTSETRKKMSIGRRQSLLENPGQILKGKYSPHWKGGITELGNLIRTSTKYKEWHAKVLAKDNWTCVICGVQGYLEVHHIIPFEVIIETYGITNIIEALLCDALWDINNGITVCPHCHEVLDKKRHQRSITKFGMEKIG